MPSLGFQGIAQGLGFIPVPSDCCCSVELSLTAHLHNSPVISTRCQPRWLFIDFHSKHLSMGFMYCRLYWNLCHAEYLYYRNANSWKCITRFFVVTGSSATLPSEIPHRLLFAPQTTASCHVPQPPPPHHPRPPQESHHLYVSWFCRLPALLLWFPLYYAEKLSSQASQLSN